MEYLLSLYLHLFLLVAIQEYSIHVRESYHAQLDNDMNRIMKMFTVVTTVFLPLTLIVGWYGMNFTTMLEITWQYGYLFVIILSIVVAILCFIYFKKKKFMQQIFYENTLASLSYQKGTRVSQHFIYLCYLTILYIHNHLRLLPVFGSYCTSDILQLNNSHNQANPLL